MEDRKGPRRPCRELSRACSLASSCCVLVTVTLSWPDTEHRTPKCLGQACQGNGNPERGVWHCAQALTVTEGQGSQRVRHVGGLTSVRRQVHALAERVDEAASTRRGASRECEQARAVRHGWCARLAGVCGVMFRGLQTTQRPQGARRVGYFNGLLLALMNGAEA